MFPKVGAMTHLPKYWTSEYEGPIIGSLMFGNPIVFVLLHEGHSGKHLTCPIPCLQFMRLSLGLGFKVPVMLYKF